MQILGQSSVRHGGPRALEELPKSIYDEGEQVFGTAERDALVSEALTLGAQPEFNPQRPTVSWGLPFTRFNRIEGFSTGVAIDDVLGGGYSTHALVRLGVADLSPNGELSLDRTDGRRKVGVGVYRRPLHRTIGRPARLQQLGVGALLRPRRGILLPHVGRRAQRPKGLRPDQRLATVRRAAVDATVHTEFASRIRVG